jgi:hypothetical protein
VVRQAAIIRQSRGELSLVVHVRLKADDNPPSLALDCNPARASSCVAS